MRKETKKREKRENEIEKEKRKKLLEKMWKILNDILYAKLENIFFYKKLP